MNAGVLIIIVLRCRVPLCANFVRGNETHYAMIPLVIGLLVLIIVSSCSRDHTPHEFH